MPPLRHAHDAAPRPNGAVVPSLRCTLGGARGLPALPQRAADRARARAPSAPSRRSQRLFPAYPIRRIDRGTMQARDAMEQLIGQPERGEPCILVGTQMLAKGHHFPHVTLVAIIDLDGGLLSADFRAAERTGQLLVQVAGRAGRAERPGEVLVQTYQPDNPTSRDWSGRLRGIRASALETAASRAAAVPAHGDGPRRRSRATAARRCSRSSGPRCAVRAQATASSAWRSSARWPRRCSAVANRFRFQLHAARRFAPAPARRPRADRAARPPGGASALVTSTWTLTTRSECGGRPAPNDPRSRHRPGAFALSSRPYLDPRPCHRHRSKSRARHRAGRPARAGTVALARRGGVARC